MINGNSSVFEMDMRETVPTGLKLLKLPSSGGCLKWGTGKIRQNVVVADGKKWIGAER